MESSHVPLAPKTQIRHFWIETVYMATSTFIIYTAENMRTNASILLMEFFPVGLMERSETGTALILQNEDASSILRKAKEWFTSTLTSLHAIEHPGLLTPKEQFEANNTLYFALESHRPMPLSSYIRHHADPTATDSLSRLISPVVSALMAMQHHGISVNTITPDTIFVDEAGNARLCIPLCLRIDSDKAPSATPETVLYMLCRTLYALFALGQPSERPRSTFTPLHCTGTGNDPLCSLVNTVLSGETPDKPITLSQIYALVENDPSPGAAEKTAPIPPPKKRDYRYWRMAVVAALAGFVYLNYLSEPPKLSELTDTTASVYELPAMLGNTDAQVLLGRYHAGTNPPDYAEALRWFQAAADQNNLYAQTKVAEFYQYGTGVPQSYREAFRWYRKAAVSGDGYAQYAIAYFYDQGWGVAQDDALAVEWYAKALANGQEEARRNLTVLWLTSKQIGPDYAKCFSLGAVAAQQNRPWALTLMGYLYEMGYGVAQNHALAREWYEKAAALNDVTAQSNLGVFYYFGKGVDMNRETAKFWFEKAAAHRDKNALNYLGRIHLNKREYARALERFQQAADQEFPEAQYFLGYMHYHGLGVPKNNQKALEWFRAAYQQGYESAQHFLKI